MQRNHRILVVDDDATLRVIVCLALAEAGHELSAAANGDEALELAVSFRPEVLLTDLDMPEKDGEGLIDELKRRDLNLPVLIITGAEVNERFLRLLRFPRIMVLKKPFSDTALLAMIERVCSLPMATKEELRSTLRLPLEIDAELGSIGEGRVRNISMQGAFIESTSVPEPGTRVPLTLRTTPVIKTSAVVAWMCSERGGFGVRFENVSREASAALGRLLVGELESGHPLCVCEPAIQIPL